MWTHLAETGDLSDNILLTGAMTRRVSTIWCENGRFCALLYSHMAGPSHRKDDRASATPIESESKYEENDVIRFETPAQQRRECSSGWAVGREHCHRLLDGPDCSPCNSAGFSGKKHRGAGSHSSSGIMLRRRLPFGYSHYQPA